MEAVNPDVPLVSVIYQSKDKIDDNVIKLAKVV